MEGIPKHNPENGENVFPFPFPEIEMGGNITGIPVQEEEGVRIITADNSVEVEAGEESVAWSNHGYKHYPNKNISWEKTVASTKNGPAKNSPDITDIERFERDAWETGTVVTNGKNWRVKEYDHVIGAVDGKETTYVRIENSANTIHGHPISEEEYNRLLR